MSSIVCSNLSFAWPGDSPLFAGLSFAVGDGRTGLVAPNGAGKSVLLRLIAGELPPAAGSITVDGTLGYLPQSLPFAGDATVADVLGAAAAIEALEALAGGEFGDAVFAAIGDDWDIEARALAQFDRLRLGHITLDRRVDSLSGGEIVAIGLAGQLLRRPRVLLLDEPTNNLDADARRRLYAALDEFTGCLLLVSHDRSLLDRMDRIAELRDGEIQLYGGGFTAYTEAVEDAQRTAAAKVSSAEQQLRRERRDRQLARERAARRSSTAARNSKDAGLPKIVSGAMKRRAQESAGRIDGVNAARVDDAASRVAEAERMLRDDDALTLDLPDIEVPAGRNLLTCSGIRAVDGGRVLFDDVDLAIRGPERIALTGRNGAGKSTLLRISAGAVTPESGTVQRAHGRVAYLSQRLDLLDPQRTVAESLAVSAPGLTTTRRMHLLAQFLFRGDRVDLPIGVLSGGERLRATLACVLHAEPAPHLLLLDEPTNNLDLRSIGQLQSALGAYRGALLVVSHDERFLESVDIRRWLRLSDGRLDESAERRPPETR
ncbi:ABC-F family ATP-binding cassette domain-containing protein [Mycobacterium sp. IDR2000157661]|uniref:ABC-F family ATP-binding cassette domain-containing protein n=1 Tax=Mycobacterium sp. IDR2000157661 TaxID=2867005 RepID=UPI001EEBAD77|nr:ABC-F family ATP-binding cassette domain-containing protein [Mycobacterium sp. IDR2000157661]ULE31480.1 ATP-binding cassette domain-containing protein [Mycobacterium sp. IDR2000157661]